MINVNSFNKNNIDSKERDKSLDFVKFIYIMMMIIYHCFYNADYDHSFEIDINRFFVFVSGSFPFMAGYFVSAHYLENLDHQSKLTCSRLLIRGIKLLSIYIFLNLTFIFMIKNNLSLNIITDSMSPIKSILISVPSEVIYDILHSISIILILGSALSTIHIKTYPSSHKYTLTIALCVLSILIYFNSSVLIACGIMGIIIGLPMIRNLLDNIYRQKSIIISSYIFGLFAAIIFTNIKKEMIIYILCVTTLFFSIKHSYGYLKEHIDQHKIVSLFSRHSLFIYIFHVPFLIFTKAIILAFFPTVDALILLAALLILGIYSSLLITKTIETVGKQKYFGAIYKIIFN